MPQASYWKTEDYGREDESQAHIGTRPMLLEQRQRDRICTSIDSAPPFLGAIPYIAFTTSGPEATRKPTHEDSPTNAQTCHTL
jgi:hypothetical protein